MRFVVLNDSRHNVKQALERQFGKIEVRILTDENYPSFASEGDVLSFAEKLVNQIQPDEVVVLTGTSEVVALVLMLLMRRDSEIRYATFDFSTKSYFIRHFDYLDIR